MWMRLTAFLILATFAFAQKSSLSLSTVSEYKSVPIFEQTVDLVVTVMAPSSVAASDRAPVSITAVLDRSGSMEGDKIDLLKRSTEFLVERLTEGDYIGVVSYASNARTDIPLSAVTSASKSRFREIIDSIQATGSTALAGGLFEGIDQQTGADVANDVVKSVLLFTDGLANTGITDIGQITSMMNNRLTGARAPTVNALGFGGDADPDFLSAIAEAGRGGYIFVSDEKAIAGSIGEVLGGLLTITAQDISVTFQPLNGARIVLIRGGNVNSANTQTTFANLFAEERRDILIRMSVPVLQDAAKDQAILEVTLRYFNTITQKNEMRRSTISIDRSVQVEETKPASVVEITRLRYRVADDIAVAVEQRESGDKKGATKTLEATQAAIAASSESDSPEAKALETDVESAQEDIKSDEFSEKESARLTAGSASVATQRSAGSSTAFASTGATSAQAKTSAEADAFIGK